jgi:nucleoside recognition membrane protein YjiH
VFHVRKPFSCCAVRTSQYALSRILATFILTVLFLLALQIHYAEPALISTEHVHNSVISFLPPLLMFLFVKLSYLNIDYTSWARFKKENNF